jgi:hypothetical protein
MWGGVVGVEVGQGAVLAPLAPGDTEDPPRKQLLTGVGVVS